MENKNNLVFCADLCRLIRTHSNAYDLSKMIFPRILFFSYKENLYNIVQRIEWQALISIHAVFLFVFLFNEFFFQI